jgi:hypothetical protein
MCLDYNVSQYDYHYHTISPPPHPTSCTSVDHTEEIPNYSDQLMHG